ncbi:MAG TPA: LPD38 domain-containing protein, partial [Methanosarcinales archaeon]|nr:LPD38 domain-containing protein [Methanosarcinales archaeon]
TAIGLIGDIAKVRKLNSGINTTADLVKMSQAGIKDAERVAKVMRENPDIVKAVENLPQNELDDIMYVDPYGNVRKTPGMDLQLEAPKADVPQIAPGKNIEAPFRLTPAELARTKQPTAGLKAQGGINTLPIENKPITSQLKPQDISQKKPVGKLKSTWDKFYSATVNNTQATANVSKEAEIMSNVARNAGATVDTIIKKGLVNMEGQKIEGKAIADIFNMPQKEAQALEDLLFETHNIDRVHQAKELTGKTTEESKLIIENIKKQYPHLEAKAKEVNTLLKNMLDEWGVKSGLVDTDLRNLVQGMYKNYVPGYRELNGVDAISTKSRGMGPAKIINKAIGGDDKLMSLQKSIPMLINKTVKSARKNELYREILKAAETGSDYAKILEPAGKIEEVLQKNATDAIIEAIKADGIDALANITDSALTADPKLGYLLTVMDNGKPVKLQIKEELFKSLQALNGKGDDDLQAALKLFKKTVTNPFKSLITGYNPMFAVRNVARDIPTAYIQGTENNPFKFAKNLGGAAKDMFKNADEFQQYKALGGEGGNYFNVEKGIKAEGKLEKILKPLGAINNLTETLPRYAEYKGTLKREGTDYATKLKALHNAQEVTVNFGKHGDVTKAIDAIVPYLNPAVQGLDKTARTFKKPEAWAKALGVITVPTAAIYAINQVVDKKGYDQLDNRTKDTNFVFPQGNGKFIKIPKTRESGAVFGALFERILRQAQEKPEAFKNYGNALKTNFLFQNPWTDNIASPLVSGIGYNKDFAGRAVVPQYMLNDKRSPKLQYDERTSEIAKEIGDKFNLSPKQVDYIIKSYGGIVGSILIPATTKGGNVVENVAVRPFTADAAYSNEITNNFYGKLDKLKQAATDKNITGKLPSKLVTPEEKLSSLYQGMTRHISDIRDGITQLGSTDEAGQKQQKLLDLLAELNKDIDYNQSGKLKTKLMIMAKEYKK